MLITADIEEKSIGNKMLFTNLRLTVDDGEKIGIVGRNGVGKTTLFRLLTREDTDFTGSVSTRPGARIVNSRQEHLGLGDISVIDYTLSNLPEYAHLKDIIDTYPDHMGDNMRKITEYSNALERFADLDYYTVEDIARRSLETYQLRPEARMSSLSGGQKRFVELVIIAHSNAQAALIDEPTNHMDYVAKQAFIDWFTAAKQAVVVITHDRDVLRYVDRIVEIKDHMAINFPGNYTDYLKQNAQRTTNALGEYEVAQRRIENVKKQIQSVRAKKASTSKTPNPFIPLENRLLKELAELEEIAKPSFWIDKESAAGLKPKMEASYHKHKAKTIHIKRLGQDERQRELVTLDEVQVGYDRPLFASLTQRILTGDRLRIVGRNGAGKTTLTQAIIEVAAGHQPPTVLHGKIICDTKLRINTYEQEVDDTILDLNLSQAIEQLHAQYGLSVNNEQIMRLLADYLFDPYEDRERLVRQLSGGQKARLQLMKLFANDPNLLILDEPTNHLDLPSIEELEAALAHYKGALVYISHDSYLAKHFGGHELAPIPL